MLNNFILSHCRSAKGQESQPPNQNSWNQMDYQVKQVVTKYVKSVEVIIKSQRKEGNKTTMKIMPDIMQIINISYCKIMDYETTVIELKRTKETIRINNNT